MTPWLIFRGSSTGAKVLELALAKQHPVLDEVSNP